MLAHAVRPLQSLRRFVALALFLAIYAAPAVAQTPAPDPSSPPPKPPEPELNLINLPTTASIKRHGSYFRLTHRFTRDLGRGDFGSLVEDLFALDNGAIIGLEYRFGITGNLQAAVHRSLLVKTIQFSGRYDRWRQSDGLPFSLSITGAVEGLDNMTDEHQGTIAATFSRVISGGLLSLYATPAFVGGTRSADFIPSEGDDFTMFVGLGGRLRVRPSVFVTGEYTPRAAGYDPGQDLWAVSVDKKTGGHMFQLVFANSFGTTFGQIARGGNRDQVYLGFNIARTF
jgi:Membrane bound beta barrel domain (DUF5777)